MKVLSLVAVAAAATTLLLSPASAQNGSWNGGYGYNNGWHDNWNDGWQRRGWNGGYHSGGWNNGYRSGWNSSDVSGRFGDPSYNSGARYRANNNYSRCTEDLGYGRYEYCDQGK